MTESRCFFLIFLLLAAAGFVIFRLDIPIRERLSQSAEKKGKMKSFKKQGRLSVLLRKLLAKQQSLVASSAMPKSAYLVLSAACVVGGFFAGRVIYRSLFISSAVAVASAFIPLLVFSFRQTKAANARLERLCSSMMILSNSYLVTDDFITSVETNVDILEYPQPFRDFLAYVTLMDSDIRSGLRRMEQQVGNPYFSQWIDSLILAQDDRALKYVAVAVVDSMHDVIQAQQESDAAMYSVWRDYLLTLILIFAVPLIFKMMMHDAYITMTSTFAGQSLFTLLLAAVVYSVFRAMKINRPLMS